MKLVFCYKLSKEIGLGYDEEGNPCETYSAVKLDVKNLPTEEDYKKAHKSFAKVLANQLSTEEKYIIPISKEEYLENTEDGEEEFEEVEE